MTLPDAAWRQLISASHMSGRKAALAITGGGSGAIGALLRIPGGSRLLIEAQVPYDEGALALYLGFAPAQASSADTAIALARSAGARVALFAPAERAWVGLGATAALVSDRPRRGEHRFHIAHATAAGVAHCTGVLAKGRRDRAAEEDLVSRAIILWLARACGVDAPPPRVLLDADEDFTEMPITRTGATERGATKTVAAETMGEAVDAVDRLLAGEHDHVIVQPDGRKILSGPPPAVLFPGSFNPVHEGHLTMARIAQEIRRQPVTFEISVTNVDKPPLTAEVVKQRIAQFAGTAPVALTRAPTFLEKARLFPGTTFVIGADTAERLVAARYYGDDKDRMRAALDEIARSGASFLVAARIGAAGHLRTLSDILIPARHAGLFTAIPPERFRFDSSSSEIRARGGGLDHA